MHISFEIYSDLFKNKSFDGKLSYRARKFLGEKLSCRAKDSI
jgi:hypothetical protein